MTSTASRERLPDRRPSVIHELTWAESNNQAATYTVTVGIHLSGQPAEIFIDGAKIGSAMNLLLQDVAVGVSLALQHGIGPTELARSLARVPAPGVGTKPASVLGAVVEALTQHPGIEKTGGAR